ncbi:MlaD family protein [Niveibacterium sp. SC-1]|uniref:MlaD family protein n=1 Tax=Niveibacterium sp. SC-1 TaxID=3135646 RepID=UPI00311DABF2
MENRAHAFSVGLFTIVLGLAVAFAMWWLSGRSERTVDLVMVTEQGVSGLSEQAAVRFRGLRSGRVTNIEFDKDNPRRILVSARLTADVPLTKALRAKLNTQGLTGFVSIDLDDDGTDPRPLAGPGEAFPEIPLEARTRGTMESVALAAERVRDIAERLALIVNDKNRERVASVLENVDRSSQHLEAVLAKMPELVERLDRVVARLDSARIDATLANIEKGTASLPQTVEQLRVTLAAVQQLSARWEAVGNDLQTRVVGEGGSQLGDTLGQLQQLSSDLSGLINSLERNPQSIVFGRKGPVPGPGEAGYAPQRP